MSPVHPIHSLSTLARVCLAAAGAFVFAATLAAQGQSTGTIEGRVFDARRGEYLEKARITVEGTRLETLTNETGHYRLPNVPAGTAKVNIFFTGLGSQSQLVTVAPGQVVQQDITFGGSGRPDVTAAGDVVQLDRFVISSSKEMEGAAIAINEQRFASNIMQVVSADEFGTIADGSIGEFMKFLPGITADYTGGDARRFSINGVPEDNVPISMGGFEMASAAGAGTRRAVELDQVSINNVSRIEINRAPTPESPGAALAGTVNFVPRSAFERSKPAYSYNVQWMFKDAERAFHKTPGPRWGEYTRKVNPGFDLSAIVPVSKVFGFSVSAGYSLQYTPQPASGIQWRGVGAATNQPVTFTGTGSFYPDTTPDNPYATNFNWRDSGKHTTRHSFATTVDWKPARYDRLSFGFQYGMLKENFATRTQTFIINRVTPGNWGPTHTWGQVPTFPTTGTAINSGQVDISNGGRIRPGRTISPSLRWIHDGPIWKSDAGVSYGNSRIQYQDIDLGAFNGMTIRRTHVQILFDDIFYLRPGNVTVLDHLGRPVDPTDLDSYSIVSANSNRQKTYDTVKQAYANLRRDMMVREIPVSLKVGFDVRNKVRDLRGPGGNLETYTYVGGDNRASTTPFTQAGLVNDDSPARFLDEAFSQRLPDFGMPKQQQVDNKKLWQDYQANPSNWTQNAATNYSNLTRFSRRAEESIFAGFARGDASFLDRRLKVVTGVRAEQTNIDAQGPLTDVTRGYLRDASGNVVRNAAGQPQPFAPTNSLEYAQATVVERGYKAKKEYLRLFPSVNVSYNIRDNLIARGAYYQTVGRPDFNQYAGGLTLPDTELPTPNVSNATRIQVNNVSIKAWQAESYMARLEYYFGNIGQLSFAYFVRDYENMFGNITTQVTQEFLTAYDLDPDTYGIYEVVTQFNVPGTIRTKGLEVAYRQQLTFLPHWARGMNFTANYSSQRGKNTFDYFQNMIPFNVNWGLSLTRPKFNVRINENYRGIQRRARITGRSIQEGTYNYRPKRLYIDVSGEYYLKRSLGLFVSVRNIGGATEDTKIYGPETPRYARFRQRDDYSSLWTFGVKGTF